MDTIIQKPTPQLNVVIISWSEIFCFLSHLKILSILILDRSMFKVKPFGTDLNKFSIKPPPVICAAELIKFLCDNFKISFVYILVGFKISFFKFLGNLFFLIIDLTREYPLE